MPRINPDLPIWEGPIFGVTATFVFRENIFLTRFLVGPQDEDTNRTRDEVALAVSNQLSPVLRDMMSSQVKLRGFIVENIRFRELPTVFALPPGGIDVPGTVQEAPLPSQTCYLLRKTTEFRGQKSRGFNFLPGAPKNFLVDGIFDGVPFSVPAVALEQAILLGPTVGGNDYRYLVGSITYSGSPAVATVRAAVVTGAVVSPIPTDRSTRKLGRGV